MAAGLVKNYAGTHGAIVSKTINTMADIGVGNVAILVGTNISLHRQNEIVTTLKAIMFAIIENGFKAPQFAGEYVIAGITIEQGKSSILVQNADSVIAPSEDELAIIYEDTFDNAPASTLNFRSSVEALIDHLLDDVLSAA